MEPPSPPGAHSSRLVDELTFYAIPYHEMALLQRSLGAEREPRTQQPLVPSAVDCGPRYAVVELALSVLSGRSSMHKMESNPATCRALFLSGTFPRQARFGFRPALGEHPSNPVSRDIYGNDIAGRWN